MNDPGPPDLDPNEVDEPAPDSSVDDLLRPVRHVMAALLRSDALSRGDVEAALRNVTEVAAQVLRVGRASVWTHDEKAAAITCTDLFEATTREHVTGAVIPAAAAPRYFDALKGARSIVAHDAMHDPRTADFAKDYLPAHGITSMLDVPVFLRGELYGILCAEHVGPRREWAFWEELIACTLADYVAMVVGAAEHVAQARELADYRTRLEQLVEERTSALRRAEDDLRIAFEASPVGLLIANARTNAIITANARAAELFEYPLETLGAARTIDFWVDKDVRGAVIEKLRAGNTVEGHRARMRTAKGREFWAELNLRMIDRGGEPCFLAGVRDVTDQVRAEEVLERLASTDGLTGALNRRRLFELAPVELARAERYGHPLTVAMVDADHFKRLNDELGHAAGDAALVRLAHVAMRDLRRVDLFARYGGEEFVALLPETDGEGARVVCERLRERVEIESREAGAPFTVSIGVAQRRAGEGIADVLRRADEAMYEAKREGRNRVKLL